MGQSAQSMESDPKDKTQATVSPQEAKPSKRPASGPSLRVSVPVLRESALLDFVRSLDPGSLIIKLGPRPKAN